MKIVRLFLVLPLLLAAVLQLAGCTDKDGNYEQVDIQMDGVDLRGTLFYSRTKDNNNIEIVKIDLNSGRLSSYSAPQGVDTVNGYFDGIFLVNGIGLNGIAGITGYVKEGGVELFESLDTGYYITVNPVPSKSGEQILFHGRKAKNEGLTVGFVNRKSGEVAEIQCPGFECSNPRWSSDERRVLFRVDRRSVYSFDTENNKVEKVFSVERGRVTDVLSRSDGLIVAIMNGGLRGGGYFVEVDLVDGSEEQFLWSDDCSSSSVRGTGVPWVIMHTKGCSASPSQGVYLYNLNTREEIRVSSPGWLARGGGWVE